MPETASPLVSIIINNYNYGRYLAAAIDSALAQTYSNCEVIVVDDGSTDDSIQIIHSYSQRIRPILKDNGGQPSAFNAGYLASSGELIAFLDADDLLHPEAVATAVASWKPGASKLQFPLEVLDPDGRPTGVVMPRAALSRGSILARYLQEGRYVASPTSGNIFARSFLAQVLPIPETEHWQTGDGYLNTAAPFFGSILALDQPLGFYRAHGNSMTSVLNHGKVNLRQMEKLLGHAALERKLFFRLAKSKNLAASNRAVSGHWMHLKLRLSYDKLSGSPLPGRYRILLRHLKEMIHSVLHSSELTLRRKLQHLFWAAAVVLLPRPAAAKVIAYGFDTAPASRLSFHLRRA